MAQQEMYYYNDTFYPSMEDLAEGLELEDDENSDDTIFKVEDCDLEPVFKLDSRKLYEMLVGEFEDRSSEDGDEWDTVEDLLKKYVNFDEINARIPDLWFPNGTYKEWTKKKLIELYE